MSIDKAVYTAHATSTGGRNGMARSHDGALELQLSTPKELGGAGGPGTNPEQLFSAGYSACFIGALKAVAARDRVKLPDDVAIDASTSIGPMTGKPGAFAISVDMKVKLPGVDKAAAEKLVANAHEVCPYSNATRGNIAVNLSVA